MKRSGWYLGMVQMLRGQIEALPADEQKAVAKSTAVLLSESSEEAIELAKVEIAVVLDPIA